MKHFVFVVFRMCLAVALSMRSAAPAAAATTAECNANMPKGVDLYYPLQIHVAAPSAAHFNLYNHDGHGTMMVLVHSNGAVTPFIMPTMDTDESLRAELRRFAHNIHIRPVNACDEPALILAVFFEVPSGRISVKRSPMSMRLLRTLESIPQ